jgi:DNA-binding response OmpR family regulator
MKSRSILVIEDDTELLRRLVTALEAAGYDVSQATDGRIGMTKFKAATPNLVLTDILMPTCEGIETILAMKQVKPDAKIVAMSGGGRIGPREFLDLASHLGADAVIAKPFRFAALLEMLDGLLDTAEPDAAAAA